jgi:hypothetical protein
LTFYSSNPLIHLIQLFFYSQLSKSFVRKCAVEQLTKLFATLLEKKRLFLLNEAELKMYDEAELSEKAKAKLNAEEKYKVWIFKRYNDFKEIIITGLEGIEASQSEAFKVT